MAKVAFARRRSPDKLLTGVHPDATMPARLLDVVDDHLDDILNNRESTLLNCQKLTDIRSAIESQKGEVKMSDVLARYRHACKFDRFKDGTTMLRVPPHRYKEPENGNWYEDGELRLWHHFRRLRHLRAPEPVREFEQACNIKLSYEADVDDVDDVDNVDDVEDVDDEMDKD